MKFLKINLIVLLVLAFIANLSAQTSNELLLKAEEADTPQQGMVFAQQALDVSIKSNDTKGIVYAKAIIATYYFYQNKIEEGEPYLKQVFQQIPNITDPLVQYWCWYAKASFYYYTGDLDKSIENFDKALQLGKKVNDTFYSRVALLSLAECKYRSEKPIEAIEYCNQALKIPESKHGLYQQGSIYYKLATVLHSYKSYEKAIDNYKVALNIFEQYGNKENMAQCYRDIAVCYGELDQAQVALENAQKAFTLFQELGKKEELINCYNLLSERLKRLSRFDEARDASQKALTLAKEINNKKLIVDALLFKILSESKFYDPETLEQLKEGYALAKEINDEVRAKSYRNYIGIYYDINKNYKDALPFYIENVDAIEKNILSVPDDLKLQYWSSDYVHYSNLILCQVELMDYLGSINSIEKSTARMLMEGISKKAGKSMASIEDVATYHKSIPSDQVVIYYANLGNDLNIITSTNTSIDGIHVADNMWTKSVANRYEIPANASLEKLRAFKKVKSQEQKNQVPEDISLNNQKTEFTLETIERIVNHFRQLLSKPTKTQAEKETLDFLGKKFYQLLIKQIENKLEGKTELLIIPAGVLAFLPFEALIMPDGRYLVEKYDIRYLPSYSVGQLIAQRKYPETRKSMLAFGNAIYDVAEAQSNSNLSQSDFNALMKGVEESSKKGESMKKYYNALGYSWDNLPGTQAELDAISTLVPTATIVKGKEVNKKNVLQMSQNGLLKDYKILHFATHGVVIPEFQELSAIVLTQGLQSDDGYLRASEVAKLNINADFVNLSACETGLGKIYEGEGVVGLTQSFLLAGANSVAVSLWQVSDQSTMEFQKELYRLLFVEKVPVSKAINQVKRTFIKGQYSQPFYWAPFIYYGM